MECPNSKLHGQFGAGGYTERMSGSSRVQASLLLDLFIAFTHLPGQATVSCCAKGEACISLIRPGQCQFFPELTFQMAVWPLCIFPKPNLVSTLVSGCHDTWHCAAVLGTELCASPVTLGCVVGTHASSLRAGVSAVVHPGPRTGARCWRSAVRFEPGIWSPCQRASHVSSSCTLRHGCAPGTV